MDIRIGLVNIARELSFESSQTAAELEKSVSDALSAGAAFIRFADDKGKVFIIPTASFGYIEIGSEEQRRIGFVA